MYIAIFFHLITLAASAISNTGESSPSGHSHNDYLQARPLWDAVENNLESIEVDIHRVGAALLVGHDEKDLDENLTLSSLYLEPLRTYIDEHDGWVYPGHELILLIDIKTPAEFTYELLRVELAQYSDILTSYTPNGVEGRAVSAIISGNRPREAMVAEKIRFASYDGRIADLDSAMSLNFVGLISDNWEDYFTWRGEGLMPAADRDNLAAIIVDAHSKGYKVRFWNLPTGDPSLRRTVWAELISSGVDLINVDDLNDYHDFRLASIDD